MAFTDVIARLAVSLNLDTAAFQTGSRRAKDEATGLQGHMSKVGKAIAGAFAGIALGEVVQQFRDMTKAAIDAAGGLGETAAQIGVTTKSLQEYRFAATQVGLSTQEMELGLAQLTRRLGDASLGVKEPAAALDKLGISLDQIKGKDTGDVIPLIATGIAKIPDPAERAAIAVDLFGKSGQKLLPLLEGGAAGVEKFRTEAERLGLVLSEGEIAKADETADKLAALNFEIEAQQNKKLLENADAIIKYEEAIGNFKLALITAVGDLENANQRYNAWALQFNANLRSVLNEIVGMAASAPMYLRRMVGEIAAAITGRLNAVWEAAKAKVREVKDAFFDLWDKVTRRSYVPDMVDDIAREMGRLDGVMVAPAKGATDKVKTAMRDMAQETRSLLARLFPEVERLLGYRKDLATLDGAKLDPVTDAAARGRLAREFMGTGGEVPVGVLNDNDPLVDARTMGEAAEATIAAFLGLKAQSRIATVAVAKSFADMADATIRSLQQLSGSIRGGGFLDILTAVVGLGFQLGSVGLFGKSLQGRINAPSTVPRYANGTKFHPGGLAVVGERRAELVELPRGSRVHPNLNALGGGGGNTYHFSGNLMTPEFWAMIERGDEQAARSGAALGQAQFANSRRWSLS